jgi:hypothetical protein
MTVDTNPLAQHVRMKSASKKKKVNENILGSLDVSKSIEDVLSPK